MSKLYQTCELFLQCSCSPLVLKSAESVYLLLYPVLIFNTIRCDIFLRRLLRTDFWYDCQLNRASLVIAFKIYFSSWFCTYFIRIKSALCRRDYQMRQCPSLTKGLKKLFLPQPLYCSLFMEGN